MKMFSICVAIISLSSGLGRGDVLAQAANAATNAAVIVDPAFGGADHGPTVGNGVSGQAFTLKVARTIVESMAKDGIAARLARQDDSFVPNDEVLLRAGPLQIQPKAYITISVSGTRIGCVRVLYPKPGLRGTVRKNTDVKDAISAAAEDQYWKESQTLANAIKTELDSRSSKICVEAVGRTSYKPSGKVNLLPALFVAPVVIIEFDKNVAGALEREGLLSVSAGIVAGLKRYKR